MCKDDEVKAMLPNEKTQTYISSDEVFYLKIGQDFVLNL